MIADSGFSFVFIVYGLLVLAVVVLVIALIVLTVAAIRVLRLSAQERVLRIEHLERAALDDDEDPTAV
jgi:cell division septal protein FtsQ